MNYSKYNEIVTRGKPGFPIQLYTLTSSHPRYVMPLHLHGELEFIRVISGKLKLYLNNVEYSLASGDIAVVNCRFLHRAEPEECKYECVVFDLKFLTKGKNQIFSEYIMPVLKGEMVLNAIYRPDNSVLYSALSSLFRLLEANDSFFELKIMSLIFNILEQLYAGGFISPTVSVHSISLKKDKKIEELIGWIEDNYREHISLQILSQVSDLSPNYLCRVFKEYTGKSPTQYINAVRIENICYEIKTSNKSVTEIAIENGFNDISYFCKVFKKHTGLSAKEYRK